MSFVPEFKVGDLLYVTDLKAIAIILDISSSSEETNYCCETVHSEDEVTKLLPFLNVPEEKGQRVTWQ